jgi:hypothetical protein
LRHGDATICLFVGIDWWQFPFARSVHFTAAIKQQQTRAAAARNRDNKVAHAQISQRSIIKSTAQ